MKFRVIASGSKGNMTYIETKEVKILVDVGISLREAKKRTDIDFSEIDAIIITHEHTDHINFLATYIKISNAKVFVQRDSLSVIQKRFKDKINGIKVKYLEPDTKYSINDLQFYTLGLSHDSLSCLGFIFYNQGKSLGYITDTGFLPIPYIELLKSVNGLIIEANHDIEMLYNSNRPWMLKQRIFSVRGHMSNHICGQILNSILEQKNLSFVVLTHLSDECNTEEIAIDTILEAIIGEYIPKIYIARQYESLDLIEVCHEH